MFNNVNFENNDKKLDDVRRFLSSKQEELDKTCRDYYSIYGDFNNDLCLVNTYFSKIARRIYDFIGWTDNEKDGKELEEIYEHIKRSYNEIIEMSKYNSKSKRYEEIITPSRQFYANMYDVILELIEPLAVMIFESFVSAQFIDSNSLRVSIVN